MSENEWKDAKPVGFYLERDKPGRVYRADRKGPPMQIRECSEWDYGEAIVVEYEDMVLRAGKEMFGQDTDTIERLCFAVSDARFLTVALIEALASGGDVVAERLRAVLDQHHEEHKGEFGDGRHGDVGESEQ